MTEENFNYLFYFLEKEDILIDETEFLFQLQSHPNYPSLLAIADTLSFFNIDNVALRIEVSQIELLPNRFLALLQEENNGIFDTQLYFVEKKNDRFFYTKNKKLVEIPSSDLELRWQNAVLLAEKSQITKIKLNKNKFHWILPWVGFIPILTLFFIIKINIHTIFFFAFPFIGLFCSIVALKDLFGVNSELINNICNISVSTDCKTIVGSNKWVIFKIVNFSDLSIVFFSTQIVGLLTFLLNGNPDSFFSIQKVLLLCALPVISLSLYFQKFVEKKWCPICLSIIITIILELLYLVIIQDNVFVIYYKYIALFASVFILVSLFWSLLKRVLTERKYLKEFQLKANRFLRSYEIFKNTLLSKDKLEMPFKSIICGNQKSQLQITIITNPFCRHCKDAHEMIDRILKNHEHSLQLKIIIKTDLARENDTKKEFYRHLMNVYLEKGEEYFIMALSFWFENKNIAEWMKLYRTEKINIERIDSVYTLQSTWCNNNNLNYTPVIFINSYKYPNVYERENLPYFIKELIEDSF